MRGNFGLFCSFSPKLPRIYVGIHCNANGKKLTVKRAIVYSQMASPRALKTTSRIYLECLYTGNYPSTAGDYSKDISDVTYCY